MKRYLMILNPNSGHFSTLNFNMVSRVQNKYNVKFDIRLTRKQGEATKIAEESEGYDAVIAGGGDGTLNEVINGTRKPIGILPIGTTNVVARELGIPIEPYHALQKIVTGKIKEVDLGMVNGRLFIMSCGIGFDAYVINHVDPKLKKFFKVLAYPVTGLKDAITYKHTKLNIKVDEMKTSGYFIVVSNTKRYGGFFEISPFAEIDDGLLDVAIFKKPNIWDTFRYALGVSTKKHIDFDDVMMLKAKSIKIDSDVKTLAHADSEIIGTTPVNIEVKEKYAKIII